MNVYDKEPWCRCDEPLRVGHVCYRCEKPEDPVEATKRRGRELRWTGKRSVNLRAATTDPGSFKLRDVRGSTDPE